MNKSIGTLITALLILLMAGSAMCATYDSNVTLENKNSTWAVIEDEASATVDFNASGDVFAWQAYGTVPNFEVGTAKCYALIYYADEDDRFVNWGGDNPGALLGVFEVNACDGSFDTGDKETTLTINLPEVPDYNINPDPWDEYCSEETDDYNHCCGAKLWIVPCDDYDEPSMTAWNPSMYLFETDLIWYDNTDHDIAPIIDDARSEYDENAAGDTINITAVVCDEDGSSDLDNMIVTVNFSEYGVEELVVLEMVECEEECPCICREYTGSVIIDVATEVCGKVVATDPSGEYDEAKVCFDVAPGPCAQLVIEGPDKALTRKSFCQGFDDENYAVYLDVTCEDGYGNPTDDRDCDMEVTGTGSASVLWHQNDECGWVIRVSDFDQPETVTITAHCVCDPDVESGTHDITFLNPIENLSVTSDPGVLYEMNDCVNISAELTDISGEPIPMPDVPVDFIVNGCWYDGADTDDNGTATIELCMRWEYDDSIDVLAVAICREGTMTLDIVEPELYRVDMINEDGSPVDGEMVCTEEQDLNYTCWTDRGTEMCCPECTPTWTSDALGDVNETGYFTALDSGTAVVEVNVSGVTDTAEIVIDCPENCTDKPNQCQTYPYSFVVTSGSVSLAGNFTAPGHACIEALGDPIAEFDNDTRGAIVDVNETATENVTLDLNGTGDTWKYNETTGNWSKYADGAVSEVLNGTYALVTPGVDPEPACTNVVITTEDPVDVVVGDTVTFTASCTDQFGDPFTCTELTWTSDNETVGTMGSPTLTALALGVTNITATGCSDSNSIQVNVTGGEDPVDRYDANGNGYIDRDELKTAIYDYLEEPIGTVISRDDLKTLIYDYLDNLP